MLQVGLRWVGLHVLWQYAQPCSHAASGRACSAAVRQRRTVPVLQTTSYATFFCALLARAAGRRGRLSVIHGLLGAPPGSLFAQMDNSQNDFFVGDVKYHLGRSATLEFPPVRLGPAECRCTQTEVALASCRSPDLKSCEDKLGQRMLSSVSVRPSVRRPCGPAERAPRVQAAQGQRQPRLRVSIAPNPSHLESIGPVVLGMVRAEQARLRDYPARSRVAGLLIHGDAAFPGLGIVAETLQLANVPGAPHLPPAPLWPLSCPHCPGHKNLHCVSRGLAADLWQSSLHRLHDWRHAAHRRQQPGTTLSALNPRFRTPHAAPRPRREALLISLAQRPSLSAMQVGFTTEPADARSSVHATDIAKAIGAPVLQYAPASSSREPCPRPESCGPM